MANRYKYINNKKWYYYLDPKNKNDARSAPGLFDDLQPNIAKNKLSFEPFSIQQSKKYIIPKKAAFIIGSGKIARLK